MFEPQPNPYQANPPGFDFGFKDPDFKSEVKFENFQFDPRGQMSAPPKGTVPPGANPESINFDNTVRDYISRQQQLNEALKQQKAIDDLYQKVVGDALPREVEIVPPDNFDLTAKPPRNITPPEDLEEIIKIKEQILKKSQPLPKSPPPNPDLNLAPPGGKPGAKPGGYKTIPNPGTIPYDIPEFRPNPKPRPNPSPPPPKDFSPPPSPKGYFPPPADLPLPKPAKISFPGAGGVAIGGLIDFGLRVANGEPPAKAGYGAAGSVAGSIVGSALAGPVGGFLGGVLGGAVADYVFDLAFPPTFDFGSDPISFKRVGKGKNYTVYRIKWNVSFKATDRRGKPYIQTTEMDRFVWGSISGYTESNISKISYLVPHTLSYGPVIFCGGEWGGPEQKEKPIFNPDFIWASVYFDYPVNFKYKIDITSIERMMM